MLTFHCILQINCYTFARVNKQIIDLDRIIVNTNLKVLLMKNVILYSLPLMVACSTANATNSVAADQKNQVASELVKSLKAKRHLAPRTGVMGFNL